MLSRVWSVRNAALAVMSVAFLALSGAQALAQGVLDGPRSGTVCLPEPQGQIDSVEDPQGPYGPHPTDLIARAENGEVRAQMTLARLYERGEGVEPDMAMAVRYWRMAEAAGDTRARYKLARAFLRGSGTDPDPSAARVLFEQGAAEGHTGSIAALARMLEDEGRTADAFRLYQSVSEEHAYARYRLALLLTDPNGVAPDRPRAMAMLREAAQAGNLSAGYRLARLLLEEAVGSAEIDEAYALLCAGVRDRHLASVVTLARAIDRRQITLDDPNAPQALYEIAAAAGHEYARYQLALRLADRSRGTYDPARARTLLDALRADGYDRAGFALADHILRSAPWGPDRALALELWQEAALAGNGRALSRIARHFPNDYVRLLQTVLAERGYYHRSVNGYLTQSTLGAVLAFCRASEIEDICKTGPMRSAVARAIGEALAQAPR